MRPSIAGAATPFFASAIVLIAASRPTGPPQEPPGLFSSHEPLRFVISADFDQLKDDRSQESENRPGTVLIQDADGQDVEVPIKVRTRGRFRLQQQICPDPPLRLNFPETNPQGTVFDGQDKLKLVTHCRDSDEAEQNTLEEYLAYRIYNLLTDMSFRVRLAEITYVDTSGKNDPVQRTAFILEDEDALAARVGGMMIEAPGVKPNEFVLDQLSLFYVFQYMIGNVDWGTGTSHNVKVIRKDHQYYPVPYDFDWTGLVDAWYAEPNRLTDGLHDSVRERLYWGVCMSGIDYGATFARFNGQREAVMALASGIPGLSEENVRSATDYLREFYETINDESKSDRDIVRACRPWL